MWHIQCAVHVQWCVAFSVNTHGLEGRLQTKTISEHFSSIPDTQRTNELSLHSLTHTHHPNMAHAIVLCECMNSKGIGNGNTDKVSFEGVSVQAFVDGTGTKEGLNA